MRLVLISDTHGMEDQIRLPSGDVLIVAGDFTLVGGTEKISRFNDWLGRQFFSHTLVISGNHDIDLETEPESRKLLTNATYLEDSGVTISGKKFWGIPWTPTFGYGWVFNATPDKMKKKCDLIPDDTDVLISHGPPRGILDRTLEGDYAGSPELLEAVNRVKPKVVVMGHIHEGFGSLFGGGGGGIHNTMFVNASVVDRAYKVKNNPWVVAI